MPDGLQNQKTWNELIRRSIEVGYLKRGRGLINQKRNAAVAAKNVNGSFVRSFRERNLVDIDRLVELGSAFRGGETFGDGEW